MTSAIGWRPSATSAADINRSGRGPGRKPVGGSAIPGSIPPLVESSRRRTREAGGLQLIDRTRVRASVRSRGGGSDGSCASGAILHLEFNQDWPILLLVVMESAEVEPIIEIRVEAHFMPFATVGPKLERRFSPRLSPEICIMRLSAGEAGGGGCRRENRMPSRARYPTHKTRSPMMTKSSRRRVSTPSTVGAERCSSRVAIGHRGW